MRRKHREAEQADVNLTPLLDIVFIMLIFFIVTASFVREEGIELLRPEPSQQPPSNDVQNVVLDISPQGRITLNGEREIDLRSIQPNVERLRAENPKASVIVRPSAETQTGRLVSVVDMVRQAGVQNVSVVRQ